MKATFHWIYENERIKAYSFLAIKWHKNKKNQQASTYRVFLVYLSNIRYIIINSI